ncbi:BnaCnng09940D [Brassica napus]|uniref:non-specific serine/threonine protein kinase n=1 Tax=Brassica napus TaxID=3708 RepID=A0A078HT86_BRANA|nr:BnaCnng09940D [Brassica napus]
MVELDARFNRPVHHEWSAYYIQSNSLNKEDAHEMGMVLFACSFLLTIFTTCVYAAINSSSPLSIGQTLSSPGGFYELGFFSPNNTGNQYVGIWFKKIVPRVIVWVANRDKPVTSSAANLTISRNGNLIIVDEKQVVIWSTGEASFTSSRSHAELLDTGNLVVIDDVSRTTVWESFENLGNTMLPQSTLMYDLSNDKKRELTSWKSYSDPSLGKFSLEITSQVPLQGLIRRGSVPYWRTGPWAKTRFTGFPQFDETYLSCQVKSSTKTQGRDTDIFYRMTNVKTPDLHQFASFLDADMCYQGCLGNCSCTAFAYISGIGCLVWNGKLVDTVQFMSNGETISIRLASSELAGSHRTKIIIATTACLSIFAILVFTAFMFWRYRAKQKEPTPVGINTSQNAWKNDFEPQDISGVNFFEMHTIRTATDNFSSSNKLGQGGFGPVYKGKLLDGKEIAAKRLSSSSDQGTGEFLNEIRLISKLQHRNLVRLLGYCIEGEEKLLIYEFMVNKSLDIFLFDSTLKLEIDWAKRFDIIQGIARGLLYLHRDSRLRVIHRDLKVSNILLDEKMKPKISDFGLARMFQGTQYQDNTRRVVGTLGYMSPEYAWAGLFSEKSDIYSLGVLMLEIISGKKISRFSFGDGSKGLLAYAWESWCETGGADLLDQDLTDSCNIYEVARCVQIGLLCVQHEASDRPNTLQVLSMITSTTDLPTPKQPIFAAQTLNDVFTSESESKHIFSVNDLTQSVSGPTTLARLGICMSSDVWITLCKCSVKCLNEMQCFKGDALDTHSVSAITKANPLSIGQTLSSPDGSYEFGFFSPNNTRNQYVGVWFKNITPQVVVWVGNRDKPVTKTPANLTLSTNGSLVLLEGEEQDLIWSIGETFSSNELRGELLDNGNFVLVDAVSGRILWQSFEHLGDTMLPQSSVMYNVPNNNKRVLSSWKSPTDPSPGEFIAELTTQLPPQGFVMRGTRPYWRGGPWARERFTGTPEMDDSHISQFSVSQDAAAGTGFLTYSLQKNSNLSYTTLTPEGSLKIRWHDGSGWVTDFEAPVSSCDVYNTCGPYGLCVRSNPPKCECLKGFIPRSDEEWNRRNWTSGCVRRTDLSCRVNSSVTTTTQGNGADVFDVVANVKPPDFYEYLSLINAEECSQRCLGNCSCMAFSFVDQIGCLVWYRELVDVMQFSAGGEVLSIRLASSELGGSNRTKIIVASAVSVCVFMIMVLASYWFWRRRHKAKQNGSTPTTMETSEDAWKEELKQQDVYFFDMQTILAITDNFSIEKKLGQGGFGPVYKGKLQDGKEIAIKRLSSSSGQGKQEFMNEIVLISKLQHRNLVRLMGCCIEGEEKLLIYEFLVNKSLNTFIFDSTKKLELDWPKRFEIIQGIACGLLYLHRDSCLRVVHRDLKVSNILLDEEMNPKISDFGLARMFQGTQHQANTRRVVGTLGYMSPEYAWTGMFSEKSDIYAFGVLLLEIITGKRISSFTIGEEGKSLLEYTWDCWRESGGADLLDQDISSSGSDTEVARCVQIGLLCIQQQALDRPNIAQVMSMLTTEMDLPEPKQPVFALQIQESDSDSKTMYSVNEITQTAIFGR